MNKTVYVTTSIPYVNGRPHVGHALELIQADCASAEALSAYHNAEDGRRASGEKHR